MADVFISYKKEERERAYALAVNLETLVVSTWLDAQLAPGQSFSEEIRAEIDRCKAQVVCWSVAATKSEWVRGEAEVGRKRGVLVPVFIEQCEPLPPFNMLHTEDLAHWDGRFDHAGWLVVLRRLGALLGRPGLAELSKLMHSTDVVAWKSWLLRYPGDPGEAIARKYVGDNIDAVAATEIPAQEATAGRAPGQRSITELRAELEVADFRLRVFRDAAKKFGWRDSAEEQRLEIEVAALREALARLRSGVKEEAATKPPLMTQLREFLKRRSPIEQMGLAAVAALCAFAVGFIFLAVLTIPVRMAQSDPGNTTQENAPATTDNEPEPVRAPAPFDVTLLGPTTNSSLFSGEFEAVGENPRWALRFSDDHATWQFEDGATHDSYSGQREVRARGAQTIYTLGEPLAIVIVQQRCSLANGATTDFEVHVRSSVSTYAGCATRAESADWPPWGHSGSRRWRFPARPFED